MSRAHIPFSVTDLCGLPPAAGDVSSCATSSACPAGNDLHAQWQMTLQASRSELMHAEHAEEAQESDGISLTAARCREPLSSFPSPPSPSLLQPPSSFPSSSSPLNLIAQFLLSPPLISSQAQSKERLVLRHFREKWRRRYSASFLSPPQACDSKLFQEVPRAENAADIGQSLSSLAALPCLCSCALFLFVVPPVFPCSLPLRSDLIFLVACL
eukprot:755851-Hanusia_phi.AAC.4